MLCRMTFDVQLSRNIDKKTDYFSPGGYEVLFKDGSKHPFDFLTYYGSIDAEDASIIHCDVTHLDNESFPDAAALTKKDFTENLDKFSEFYIYLGEDGESPGLNVSEVRSLMIEFFDDAGDCMLSEVHVPKNKIPRALFM